MDSSSRKTRFIGQNPIIRPICRVHFNLTTWLSGTCGGPTPLPPSAPTDPSTPNPSTPELIEGGFSVAQTDDAAPMDLQDLHIGPLSDGKWKVSLRIIEGSGSIEAAELSPCSHLMFPKAVLPVRRKVLPPGKHQWTTRVDAVEVGTDAQGSTATR
jgi:hypothetical protein